MALFQVPQRVTNTITQTIPGKITYRRICENYLVNVTTYDIVPHSEKVNGTRRKCEKKHSTKCHNFDIPQYMIASEPKRERVQVNVPACKHRVVTDRYCHTFPVGNLECRDTQIRRGFRVNKIKCDRDRDRSFCFNIPIPVCK